MAAFEYRIDIVDKANPEPLHVEYFEATCLGKASRTAQGIVNEHATAATQYGNLWERFGPTSAQAEHVDTVYPTGESRQ